MPFSQSLTATNLGTTTVNIPTTDTYNFVGTVQTPVAQTPAATQGAGGGAGTGTGGGPTVPSLIVTVVNQNGTPIYTSAAGDRGFSLRAVQCTAADVITVVTSSSLASDQQPNAMRLTLAVSEGPI